MKIGHYAWMLCAGLLLSCSHPQTESNPAKLLGKPMVLPEDIWEVTHVAPSGLKILVYYNQEGCTSCRLKQLPNWKDLVIEVEHIKQKKSLAVDFVFVFQASPDNPVFAKKIREYGFDYPVYYDAEGFFEKNNILPENTMYHCFLLSEHNQILLIGAPIFSPKLWDHYKNCFE
ncbi:MAG: hypothetical protein RR330_01985 [Alistipes sp.]